jgi:hypothetical protein
MNRRNYDSRTKKIKRIYDKGSSSQVSINNVKNDYAPITLKQT